MVGGAAMFPRRIIQNAVNSKDHTTLVAAVKAAGLVETLEARAVHGVRADQRRFGKLPPARSTSGQAGEQGDPDQDPHLSRGAGQARRLRPDDGKKLKTAEGEELTVKRRRQDLDHRRQGRHLDGHDHQRSPVERAYPCGRYRADAVVLSGIPRVRILTFPKGCAGASRGDPARFFVKAAREGPRFHRVEAVTKPQFPAYIHCQ